MRPGRAGLLGSVPRGSEPRGVHADPLLRVDSCVGLRRPRAVARWPGPPVTAAIPPGLARSGPAAVSSAVLVPAFGGVRMSSS